MLDKNTKTQSEIDLEDIRNRDCSDEENSSEEDINETMEKMQVAKRQSPRDVQMDLFELEEKRKLLYRRAGIFQENA